MAQPLHFASHDACEALTASVADSTLGDSGGARRREYANGSAIWTPADLPDRVFRLGSGRVHIVTLTADGDEHLYCAVGPGELFGEICFCDHRHQPHGSFARSIGRSEVWTTSYIDFRRHLRGDPSVADSVIQTFCRRVADAQQRVQILARRDARERLARLLLHLAERKTVERDAVEAALTITHSDLAAMAALSRPHVSVLMTELRSRRLVAYGRSGPLRVRVARLRRSLGDTDG